MVALILITDATGDITCDTTTSGVMVNGGVGPDAADDGAVGTVAWSKSVSGRWLNCDPFAIELVAFNVTSGNGYIILDWDTDCEINNSKWLIVRSTQKDSGYEQIAELPARGPLSEYQYIDSLVLPNTTYYYKLGDVSECCGITWHGPVSAIFKGDSARLQAIQYALYFRTPMPSPFKDKVRLEYQLPGWAYNPATPVSMKIYDTGGRLVRVLVDEPQKPGPHTVYWDGKDENGQPISSGSYFCHLKTDGQQIRKLLHIK
ncbi:MAG: hypothetical protein HY769_07870 [Candidatus Stahlbacteria bacterium]|nr:hypothetical protein [Candidatus Stahlbacteria bacterium]